MFKNVSVTFCPDNTWIRFDSWSQHFYIQRDQWSIVDGRYVADAGLFIDAFGVNTNNLRIFQCTTTSNIVIKAAFNITGTGADLMLDGVTFGDLFLQGIEEVWSGSFGDYNVSTFARSASRGISVNIVDGGGVSSVSHSIWGWRHSRPGSVTMYTHFSDETLRTAQQFMFTAAHEFGHNLGIGDHPSHAAAGNIMRWAADGRNTHHFVSAENISDVLESARRQRRQARW